MKETATASPETVRRQSEMRERDARILTAARADFDRKTAELKPACSSGPGDCPELDVVAFRRTIRLRAQQVKFCFEQRLVARPAPADWSVVVDFLIRPDGSLEAIAERSSNADDPGLVVCMLDQLRTAVFAEIPSRQFVATSYTFALHQARH